jgi:hypothetical protein
VEVKKGNLKFLSIVRRKGAQWLQCVLCATQNVALLTRTLKTKVLPHRNSP